MFRPGFLTALQTLEQTSCVCVDGTNDNSLKLQQKRSRLVFTKAFLRIANRWSRLPGAVPDAPALRSFGSRQTNRCWDSTGGSWSCLGEGGRRGQGDPCGPPGHGPDSAPLGKADETKPGASSPNQLPRKRQDGSRDPRVSEVGRSQRRARREDDGVVSPGHAAGLTGTPTFPPPARLPAFGSGERHWETAQSTQVAAAQWVTRQPRQPQDAGSIVPSATLPPVEMKPRAG